MADPTANKQIEHRGNLAERSFPMDKASMTLYAGQLIVLDDTGYAVKAAATASYRFCGVCSSNQDAQASAAAAADGTNRVKVFTKGEHKLTVTSVAATSVGCPVFVSDSGTLVLTPTEVFAGWVTEYVTTNTAWVELAGDFVPHRYDVTLAIPTSAASSTKKSAPHTFRRPAYVLAAYVNAQTYPNYATSVVDVDKYDLSGTATVAVVNATDIDAKTANTAIDLTVITTAGANVMAAGDSIWGSQTLGASEVAASDGLAVTLECMDYGRPNA